LDGFVSIFIYFSFTYTLLFVITETEEKVKDLISTHSEELADIVEEPEDPFKDSEKSQDVEPKLKRRRTNSESDGADLSPTKRKKSNDVTPDTPADNLEDKIASGKKKSRKRKSRSKTADSEEPKVESDLDNKSGDIIPEKKSKLAEVSESVEKGEREVKTESSAESKQNKENSSQKKKRFRRKKDKKEKEFPELRVLPK
jgi:hypothetical protein